MAPKLATGSVDSIAANTAHAELSKFVELENPGVVNRQPDTALDFDLYLRTPGLQETNVLVTDFLANKGKRLAAEFLDAKDARLVRSFVVLYCARQTRVSNRGLGKVTIFLALGPLSCGNGLPKFENNLSLGSGDALLVGNDTLHIHDIHSGGGFALVSDWTT